MVNEETGTGVSRNSIWIGCCNEGHLEIIFSYIWYDYILYINRIFIFPSNTVLSSMKRKINKNQ